MRLSTNFSRFFGESVGSLRKARTASEVGGWPVMSKKTRRMNSASLHSSLGFIFRRSSFAFTARSMKLYSGIAANRNPVRSPMTVTSRAS